MLFIWNQFFSWYIYISQIFLFVRSKALPKRQPNVKSEQNRLRNQESLVAVGETSIFVLNESKQKWETICQAPLDENYRKYEQMFLCISFLWLMKLTISNFDQLIRFRWLQSTTICMFLVRDNVLRVKSTVPVTGSLPAL